LYADYLLCIKNRKNKEEAKGETLKSLKPSHEALFFFFFD